MKELSIEEKDKRYDEALARARNLHKDAIDMGESLRAKQCEIIFPELKESEDEKIRKALMKFMERFPYDRLENDGVSVKDAVAWLEKQGEQKPADKIEPKFKVGDWVVYTGYLLKDSGKEIYVMQVASVEDDRYNFTDTSTLCFDSEKDMRSWTIQDAKDGDVLYLQKDGKEHIIIYKGVIKERFKTFVSAYCAYNGIVDAFCFADVSKYVDIAYGGIMPATKEQRDLLFQKMHDAGYEWDIENKELKKIKQKPAWSKEDELTRNALINLVETYYGGCIDKSGKNRLLDFLKSLRPQNRWKPSKEQMYWLKNAIDSLDTISVRPSRQNLESLYNDLKKL